MTVCQVEVCDKPVLARGWCSGHYWRWRRTGTPGITAIGSRTKRPKIEIPSGPRAAPYKPGTLCAVEVCDRQAKRRGLCQAHYMRYLHLGDPGTEPIRPRSKVRASCKLERCDKTVHGAGYCNTHYKRYRTGAELRCDNQRLENLKSIRLSYGLSLRRFAEVAGVEFNVIARAETGRFVQPRNVVKIVAAVAKIRQQRRKVGVA